MTPSDLFLSCAKKSLVEHDYIRNNIRSIWEGEYGIPELGGRPSHWEAQFLRAMTMFETYSEEREPPAERDIFRLIENDTLRTLFFCLNIERVKSGQVKSRQGFYVHLHAHLVLITHISILSRRSFLDMEGWLLCYLGFIFDHVESLKCRVMFLDLYLPLMSALYFPEPISPWDSIDQSLGLILVHEIASGTLSPRMLNRGSVEIYRRYLHTAILDITKSCPCIGGALMDLVSMKQRLLEILEP